MSRFFALPARLNKTFSGINLLAPLALALSFSVSCSSRITKDTIVSADSSHFVSVKKVSPTIQTEMRYFGFNNFVGRPIAGYKSATCYLTREAAFGLLRVQQELEKDGLSLRVYDCYRPQKAVDDFIAWSKNPNDQKTKAEFYPNVDKSKVFELGYVASRSGHTRGSTVDLTLVNLKNENAPLDMGTPYDFFSPRSATADPSVIGVARENRDRLKSLMEKHGFKNYEKEWWHFTLNDEPYPNIYFDFNIEEKY